MHFSSSIVALAAALGVAGVMGMPAPNPQATPAAKLKCNADNVLRALRRFSTDADPFCRTYTKTAATAGQAYPTYLQSYTTSTSRISSACTCLNGPETISLTMTDLGPYSAPTPTATESASNYTPVDPTDLPTVTGAPLPLQTQAVVDAIPPTADKIVIYGALGEDNDTSLITHIDFHGPAGYPLVNLDDLIPGLAQAPTCGASSITLKFINQTVYNTASTAWAGKKFTLLTSGGIYCGTEGTHNFFKVESTTFVANGLAATLDSTKLPFEEAIESFDASYGTISLEQPMPEVFKRSLIASHIKRGISIGDLNLGDVWDTIVTALKGSTKRVTIPLFDLTAMTSMLLDTRVPVGDSDISLTILCENCGVKAKVGFFGQFSFNVFKWQMVGVTMGVDFSQIEFNIDLGFNVKAALHKNIEVLLASFNPYSINVGEVFSLGPILELVANLDFKVDLEFQVDDIGFNGQFENWSLGYNLLTKQPVFDGNLRPTRFEAKTPRFIQGVTVVGVQGGEISLWVGPRAWCGLKIVGRTVAEGDITLQFPNVRATAQQLPRNYCPNPPAIPDNRDRCTHVYADVYTRATAHGGVIGFGDASATLFESKLGEIVNDRFSWDWPLRT